MSVLLPAVVVIPAVAALVGLLLTRAHRALPVTVALLGAVLTLACAAAALLAFLTQSMLTARPVTLVGTLPALDAGALEVPLQLQVTGPTLVVAAVVALVTACVQVYSAWYLAADDRYAVFAATVSLFGAAMLLVVLSADLILTLVGWEVMGWCSYLLIGHWSRRDSARAAAHKAFMVTRTADIGFVLGVVLLAAGPGSTSYGAVLDHWGATRACTDAGVCAGPSTGLLDLAFVLLVIGVLGKSAQVPFHDWLPDAMEGPTPASALIHAATMVAAGTFVLAQLLPILEQADVARVVLAVSVALTMVWSAVVAFGQSDLKRLLAYSTVSQVAIMLSPLAVVADPGEAGAATFHLYAHAFFKALLFLGIGWMALASGGTAATALRGAARRSELVRIAFGFALLALAGLPFVVGGLSKEHVISAVTQGWRDGEPGALLVLVALLLTVVLTAAYSMRAWLVVTAPPDEASASSAAVGVAHGPATMPASVAGVLVVLLAGTVLGGLVLGTGLLGLAGGISVPLLLLTVLLMAVGAGSAWWLSRPARGAVVTGADRRADHGRRAGARRDPGVVLVGSRMPLFDNGFGAERAYRLLVERPVLVAARLAAHLDDRVIDATARGTALGVRWLGREGHDRHAAERPATGLVWVVGAAAALAAVGVAAWR